jgi:hypothetical protein
MVLVLSALVFVTVSPSVTQTRIQDVLHQGQDGFLVVFVNTHSLILVNNFGLHTKLVYFAS